MGRRQSETNTAQSFGLGSFGEFGFGSPSVDSAALRAAKTRSTAVKPQFHEGVDQRLLREPHLAMGPYGRTWQESVVTGPQNAVKKEMRDFHIIVTSLLARGSSLTKGDLDSFLVWFHPFHNFIQVFFDAEENILFAAIERDTPLKGRLSRENREPFREKMLGILLAVKNCKQSSADLELYRTITQIKKAIDKFSIQIVNFFLAENTIFPKMLHSMYEPRQGLEITRSIVKTFAKGPQPQLTVCMLGRWLKDELPDQPRAYAEWKFDSLSKWMAIPYAIWEKKFDRRVTQVAYFTKKKKEHLTNRAHLEAALSAASAHRQTDICHQSHDLSEMQDDVWDASSPVTNKDLKW